MRGTLVIGQSGGPTAVINASLAGVLREAGRHPQVGRVYGLVGGIEGVLTETFRDLTGESAATLAALRRTPGALLRSCRTGLAPSDDDRLVQVLAAHDVRYFLYAGGNGSMYTCLRVREAARSRGYDVRVVGVPKTIDNDLMATDHCPGYGSAARFIARTVQDTGLDLVALQTFVPVLITEVMGRNAGWLAAAAVLAKETDQDAPHRVYVPERAFDEDSFLRDVRRVHGERGSVSVVVSEGIRDAKGELVGSGGSAPTDALGRTVVALGRGPGVYLAELVTSRLGLAARCNRPGTMQRVSSAHLSDVDVAEAEAVGRAAVRQAVGGEDGCMITLVREPGPSYRCTTGRAPLEDVAGPERRLPAEYLMAEGTGIAPAYREYALPLIGDPLPAAARLDGPAVVRRM